MSQLVIGIPGPWEDRATLMAAVMQANQPHESPLYLAMGELIMDLATKMTFGFELYEPSPDLPKAFKAAGQGRFSAEELEAIAAHKHTVYIVCGEPFESPAREHFEAARALLKLGAFMLDAGGIAVKVESTGIAHTADRWLYYHDQGTILALYDAFVTLVGGSDFNYTCGMHTFGLPDVSVTTEVPVNQAPSILIGFNQYQLLESPDLADGARFAASLQDPSFTLSKQAYGYDEDELLNNPFGGWHLELAPAPGHAESALFRSRGEPLFMAIPNNDPELTASVEQARASLPWFLNHFNSPYEYGSCQVKTYLEDGEESAYLWTALLEEGDQGLQVQIFEIPPEFVNYEVGQQLLLRADDIYDWSITRKGALIGGFSLRLQRKRLSVEERRQFDLYCGNIAYAPLDEVL